MPKTQNKNSKNDTLSWPSEQRMSILLTKIPLNKSLISQHAFLDKIHFWKQRIHDGLQNQSKFSFTIHDLISNTQFNCMYKDKKPPDNTIFDYIFEINGQIPLENTRKNTSFSSPSRVVGQNSGNRKSLPQGDSASSATSDHFNHISRPEFIKLTDEIAYTTAVINNLDKTWSYWIKNKTFNFLPSSPIKLIFKPDLYAIEYVSSVAIDHFVQNFDQFLAKNSEISGKFYSKNEAISLFEEALSRESSGVKAKNFDVSSDLFRILIAHLKLQNLVKFNENFTIFKFKKFEENSTYLSEIEITKSELSSMIEKLNFKIFENEKNVENHKNTAKFHMQKKEKSRAIAVFKKSKIVEIQLAQLYAKVDNLQNLLDSIDQQLDNLEIAKSLKAGGEVLKKLNSELKVEEVDSVMDSVQENVENVNELADALAGGLALDKSEDNLEELENELEDLIHDENLKELHDLENKRSVKELEPELDLPEVPNVIPELPPSLQDEPKRQYGVWQVFT